LSDIDHKLYESIDDEGEMFLQDKRSKEKFEEAATKIHENRQPAEIKDNDPIL